jgi:hypothetical protein
MAKNDANLYFVPALREALGFFGFVFGFLIFFKVATSVLNTRIPQEETSSSGLAVWIIFAISLVVGVMSMILGLVLALHIQVRDDKANYFISCLWHFFVNGTVLWIILWTGWILFKFGPGQAKEFARGWILEVQIAPFLWQAFGMGILASIMAGIVAGLNPKNIEILFGGILICFLGAANLQMKNYQIQSYWWILLGIGAAIAATAISTPMIKKDAKKRRKLRELKS